MLIAALFIKAKMWKQPIHHQWTDGERKCDFVYVHTYNGISFSHRKKEVMPFVTTWMHLEGILPSEIRVGQLGFISRVKGHTPVSFDKTKMIEYTTR